MGAPKRIGPYEIVRLLGSGGMGEIFLAHDHRLDRPVAIKRLLSTKTPAGRHERFRREARIAARLNHPTIVQIYDVVREGDSECIVMEYVEGKNLRDFMARGALSVRQLLPLALQIALGMATAHDNNVIHRDLKSENILITRAGRVKITDFGIAKLLGEDTADSALVGTYRAMSPEQVLGVPVDRRSDMFSFGILLYEALSGQSPFHADTPFATLQRIVHAAPRPLIELVPDVPPELAALIEQLLQKDPMLRPRDFHDIAEALAEIAGGIHGEPCTGVLPEGHPPVWFHEDTMGSTDSGDDTAMASWTAAHRMDARRSMRPDATELSDSEQALDWSPSAMAVLPRALWRARASTDAAARGNAMAGLRVVFAGRIVDAMLVGVAGLASMVLMVGVGHTLRPHAQRGGEVVRGSAGEELFGPGDNHEVVAGLRRAIGDETSDSAALVYAMRGAWVGDRSGVQSISVLPIAGLDGASGDISGSGVVLYLQQTFMVSAGADRQSAAGISCDVAICVVALRRVGKVRTPYVTLDAQVLAYLARREPDWPAAQGTPLVPGSRLPAPVTICR